MTCSVLVALRSIYVPPNDSEPILNRKEVSRAALYCLIVDSAGNSWGLDPTVLLLLVTYYLRYLSLSSI